MSIRFFKVTIVIAMLFLLMAFVFMALWNYVIPPLFKIPEINFLQSSSLIIMSRILFASIGRPLSKDWGSKKPIIEKADTWRSANDFKAKWESLCSYSATSATHRKATQNEPTPEIKTEITTELKKQDIQPFQ